MKIYKITEASEYLGVSINTLKTLANNGKVKSFKTSGKHRHFRQDDLDAYMGVEKDKQEKLTVIYARCSTAKQKENLERQKDRLRKFAENKGGKYIKKYFPRLYKEMKEYGFPFSPNQIIHPYMFGDGERKATCLWLKGLPKLKETNVVPIKWVIGKNGKKYTATHYGTCFKTNREEQRKLRSKTFPGIARAMAEQWGG